MRAALVIDGVVKNVILVGEDYVPPVGYDLVPDPDEVAGKGYFWDGTGFSPPLATEEPDLSPIVDISRRQFFQALTKPGYAILNEDQAEAALDGVIPAPLVALIDGLPPEVNRFDVRMLVKGAGTFQRWHPVAVLMASGFGWDEQKTDGFWRFAAGL